MNKTKTPTKKKDQSTLVKFYQEGLNLADMLLPFQWLAVRFYIASVFFVSGQLKLDDGFFGIGKGSWDSTLTLFEYEYAVPLLPPGLAAILATFGEIVFGALIVLGLGSRFAAAGLLVMTAVIEFTYQSSPTHMVWALFLGLLLFYGPGKLSLDHFFSRKHFPHRHLKLYKEKYGELTAS